MKRFTFLGRLDRYVWRVSLGSFAVCLCFVFGIFVLFDLIYNLDDFLENLQGRHLGFLLIFEYYLTSLPFIFLMVAPFVMVTAGMFAVSRLMGANEVAPMLFTGRSLYRVLAPVFFMGLGSALVMGITREFILPEIFTRKDDLTHQLRADTPQGRTERIIKDRIVRLGRGETLFVDRYFVRSMRIDGLFLHIRRRTGDYQMIKADRAYYRDDEGGGGWHLDGGRHHFFGTEQSVKLDYLPAGRIKGLDPMNLRKVLKDRRELMDLSYSDLMRYVRERPEVDALTVALHYHISFPLANLILLLLALPFALRFERGSKIERVFFALLVCAAYLITDLIFRNLGETGLIHPVVATWFPTILFGSLGVVMFDTVRT